MSALSNYVADILRRFFWYSSDPWKGETLALKLMLYGGPIGEVFRKFRCLRTEICVVRENIFNVRRKKYLPKYIYH